MWQLSKGVLALYRFFLADAISFFDGLTYWITNTENYKPSQADCLEEFRHYSTVALFYTRRQGGVHMRLTDAADIDRIENLGVSPRAVERAPEASCVVTDISTHGTYCQSHATFVAHALPPGSTAATPVTLMVKVLRSAAYIYSGSITLWATDRDQQIQQVHAPTLAAGNRRSFRVQRRASSAGNDDWRVGDLIVLTDTSHRGVSSKRAQGSRQQIQPTARFRKYAFNSTFVESPNRNPVKLRLYSIKNGPQLHRVSLALHYPNRGALLRRTFDAGDTPAWTAPGSSPLQRAHVTVNGVPVGWWGGSNGYNPFEHFEESDLPLPASVTQCSRLNITLSVPSSGHWTVAEYALRVLFDERQGEE